MDVLTDSVGIEYFNVVVYDEEIKRLRAQRVDRPIFISFIKNPPKSKDNPYDYRFVVMRGVWDVDSINGKNPLPVHCGDAESCVSVMIQETFCCLDYTILDDDLSIICDVEEGGSRLKYIYYIVPFTTLTEQERDKLGIID